MLEFGVWLSGYAARAGIVSLIGALLYLFARRGTPSVRETIATTSFLALLTLPALSFAPLPKLIPGVAREGEIDANSPDASERKSAESGPSESSDSTDKPKANPSPLSKSLNANESLWSDFQLAFRDEFARRVRSVERREAVWPIWVAWVFLLGLISGAVRLVLGLIAAELVRKRAEVVEDREIGDRLILAKAEMGCRTDVELLESASVGGPAVLGGRKPCILLPRDWREWDESERDAVIAHELAHVMRQDFFKGLIAHVGVAFHFYLPPVHWLAARLRMEQELRADAWAARVSGGRDRYLKTLARLALRRDERPAAWPARAFLPGRGMFLRRIEMLRQAKRISHEPTTGRARFLIVGILAAAAILAASWRTPQTKAALAAGPGEPAQASTKTGRLDMSFIPADCPFFVVVRPAELLGRPEYATFRKNFRAMLAESSAMETMPPPERIEQITAAWSTSEPAPKGPGPRFGMAALIALRAERAFDWKSFVKKQLRNSEEFSHAGKTYYREKTPNEFSYSFGQVDDRTLVIAKESRLKDLLAGLETPKGEHAWDPAWKKVPKGQAALALDVAWFADVSGPILNRPDGPQAMFGPLWKDAKALAVSIDGSKELAVHAAAVCSDADGAQRVAETLNSAIVLAKNGVEQMKDQLANMPANAPGLPPANFRPMLDRGIEPLLGSVEVKQEGATVRLRGSTKFNLASILDSMLPSVTAARAAARRAQSVNNMKQIGLAFHNFHSANDRFPGNILSKTGKPLLSWRVAILPYIEQQGLYEQFHRDEAWDSPHNKKLIEKMPQILVVPNARLKPGATSYFVLDGPETIMTSTGEGTKVSQITDGTVNTILVVEAKRDIPWTKPDDIEFDAEKAEQLPELGGYFEGGFNALFADGSVRFIKKTIDLTTFKALTTKSGGEVIDFNAF